MKPTGFHSKERVMLVIAFAGTLESRGTVGVLDSGLLVVSDGHVRGDGATWLGVPAYYVGGRKADPKVRDSSVDSGKPNRYQQSYYFKMLGLSGPRSRICLSAKNTEMI